MAQIPYRANLSAATFPLTLSKAGRTVIVPGADQNFDRRVDPAGDTSKNVGIPQAIYMENVIPTYDGYQSVGWKVPLSTGSTMTLGAGKSAFKVIQVPLKRVGLTDVYYATIIFANDTIGGGEVWFCIGSPETSGFTNTISGLADLNLATENSISWAFVQGVTYLYVATNSGVKLYTLEYNFGTATLAFTDVTAGITGLVLSNNSFIIGSFNYLIVVRIGVIAWSSLTNALDFAPSLITGAGTESLPAENWFYYGYPSPAGFIMYTPTMAMSAQYTGNRAYPWRFKEVPNSSGISTVGGLSGGTNLQSHVLFASNGCIQEVTVTEARNILPQISDYLSTSDTYDTFNSSTKVFTPVKFVANDILSDSKLRNVRLTAVLDRYLIISYVTSSSVASAYVYEYALIVDTVLGRIGRLKRPHTVCFGFNGIIYFIHGITGVTTTYRMYTELQDQVIGGGSPHQHSGVLVLGKFQYVRERFITLEHIDIESVQDSAFGATLVVETFILPSLDGKNFTSPITPTQILYSGSLLKYNSHATGKNLTIGLLGAFEAATVDLRFQVEGKF